jgi:hypothetical protein
MFQCLILIIFRVLETQLKLVRTHSFKSTKQSVPKTKHRSIVKYLFVIQQKNVGEPKTE